MRRQLSRTTVEKIFQSVNRHKFITVRWLNILETFNDCFPMTNATMMDNVAKTVFQELRQT